MADFICDMCKGPAGLMVQGQGTCISLLQVRRARTSLTDGVRCGPAAIQLQGRASLQIERGTVRRR